MATSAPTWLRRALDDVAALGFFSGVELDEYRIDDLWGMVEDRWGSAEVAHGVVMGRLLALDSAKTWQMPYSPLQPTEHDQKVTDWLSRILSRAGVSVASIVERWSGGNVTLEIASSRGRHQVLLRLRDGVLATADLAAAASAVMERPSFRVLRTDDEREWITVVDAAEAIAAKGVSFGAQTEVEARLLDRQAQASPPATRPANAEQPRIDYEKLVRDAEPLVRKHERNAWIPVCRGAASSQNADQLGGVPWMKEGERAPRCPSCKGGLALGAQIDLGSHPMALGVSGLLQCFVCTNDDCGASADALHARVVQREDRSPRGKAELPAVAITGWQAHAELPAEGEWTALGIPIEEPARTVAAEHIEPPLAKDKCGGWPAWIQGAALPLCPRCRGATQLVLQLASDDHLPVHFGDEGILFVALCREHPEAVEGWIEYY